MLFRSVDEPRGGQDALGAGREEAAEARGLELAQPEGHEDAEDGQEAEDEQPGVGAWRGPSLPLEAVEDGAGAVIRLKTPELPAFLQR